MSAVTILLGETPRLDPAVAALVMADLDIVRTTPGTPAAALAMARSAALMRTMTAPQVGQAIAILDGVGWSNTVH
jgi:hypothetical protein